jgi:hypothetical protein
VAEMMAAGYSETLETAEMITESMREGSKRRRLGVRNLSKSLIENRIRRITTAGHTQKKYARIIPINF